MKKTPPVLSIIALIFAIITLIHVMQKTKSVKVSPQPSYTTSTTKQAPPLQEWHAEEGQDKG